MTYSTQCLGKRRNSYREPEALRADFAVEHILCSLLNSTPANPFSLERPHNSSERGRIRQNMKGKHRAINFKAL